MLSLPCDLQSQQKVISDLTGSILDGVLPEEAASCVCGMQ